MITPRNRKSATRPTAKRKPGDRRDAIARQSSLFQEFAAEREEILRHKWLLSERAGCDVGFDAAAYDWISHHRAGWKMAHRRKSAVSSS